MASTQIEEHTFHLELNGRDSYLSDPWKIPGGCPKQETPQMRGAPFIIMINNYDDINSSFYCSVIFNLLLS